jgi:uncharacterized protein
MTTYTGQDVYALIISGAKNVVVNELNLNKINVFPVPDGDTGTNLSLTMNMVIQNTPLEQEASRQSHEIASVAINHAYGNSGMIFAQYLNGFAEAVKEKSSLSAQDIAQAFKVAAERAFSSVAQPKDGTILTVMNIWAQIWQSKEAHDLELLFEEALESLRKGVENTKHQLKVLKDNNVVDAGAMAFFYFMEGMHRFLKTRNLDDLVFESSHLDLITEPLSTPELGQYRFCTQFLLRSSKTNLESLTEHLKKYGDSLVINQTGDAFSIHLHTNQAAQVMKDLLQLGVVTSHKVDDMFLQSGMIHQAQARMAIITDSIADIPAEYVDTHHLVVMPLNIIIDSIVYMDKVTMLSQDFYQHLDDYQLNPSSSQPTLSAIERTFKQVLGNYDEVIAIFVSAQMSGTYNNVKKVLDKLDLKDKKVEIIDSKLNSVAQGLLVKEALRLKSEQASFETIVQHLYDLRERIKIFVSVKDLKYMLRGGRVSKVQGFVLSKLKLQPVISIDEQGKGIIPYKSLSQKSAVKSILKAIKQDYENKGIDEYALVYADDPKDLDGFKQKIEDILGKAPAYIESISPIVGLNAGKGAFAVGYITSMQTKSKI